MKKLLYVVPALFVLTGCFEKENPLIKIEPKELQFWITQNVRKEVRDCSKFWADPDNVNSADLDKCEVVQELVAKKMNITALSNEEITPDNILLPAVWKTFVVEQEKRDESRKLYSIYKKMKDDCKKLSKGKIKCINKANAKRKEMMPNGIY